jgi:tetratricopeptide (TPR) repeat protein
MKTFKSTLATAIAVLALAPVSTLVAQEAAKVHGHVQNPIGQAVTTGEVKFTKDKTGPEKDQKFTNTFPLDGQGNYNASGIAPGDYFVYVTSGDKRVDRQELTVKAGDDKTLDFDMSRAEYMNALTPEEKKNIEEFKKKNEAAMGANKVIANLNATLKTTRADLDAARATNGDVSKDVDAMKAAVASKPDEALLWITYGDTLQSQGDHLAAAVKASGKAPATDEATVKMYSDAADAYKKGIDASVASKKPNPADQAIANNQMGNSLAKAGKVPDASAAFDAAAKLDPTKAGMYFNNEAAILFNAGKTDDALAAANKAIAADPTRPDPYFIKGQALVQHATVDPKTQLPVAPPGCLEAYQKYLELAPDGKNAPAVKDVLAGFGQKIDTKYRAGKK